MGIASIIELLDENHICPVDPHTEPQVRSLDPPGAYINSLRPHLRFGGSGSIGMKGIGQQVRGPRSTELPPELRELCGYDGSSPNRIG